MKERLRYLTLNETPTSYEIVVQLDGGGEALDIFKNAPAKEVVVLLQALATRLENSIKSRERPPLIGQ